MELDEELIFTRFPADKQEQVRQLVAYAQLMGLNGKDLVSIGGKLDRLKASAEWKRNKELIDSTFMFLNVGRDKGEYALNNRWRIKTSTGSYTFHPSWGEDFTIKSNKTGAHVHGRITEQYSTGNGDYYKRRRYAIMLEVVRNIPLNF